MLIQRSSRHFDLNFGSPAYDLLRHNMERRFEPEFRSEIESDEDPPCAWILLEQGMASQEQRLWKREEVRARHDLNMALLGSSKKSVRICQVFFVAVRRNLSGSVKKLETS